MEVETKRCGCCKEFKILSEFRCKDKKKKTLQSYCIKCKREIDVKSYNNNENGRRDKIRARALVQIEHCKVYIENKKFNQPCVKCGIKKEYLLDFHHKNKLTKKCTISDLMKTGCSIKMLQNEIDKCVLLCSNCHREYHYFERLNIFSNIEEYIKSSV